MKKSCVGFVSAKEIREKRLALLDKYNDAGIQIITSKDLEYELNELDKEEFLCRVEYEKRKQKLKEKIKNHYWNVDYAESIKKDILKIIDEVL